jgi:hypothetical protein
MWVESEKVRHALLEESNGLSLTGARELVEASRRSSLARSLLLVLPAALDPAVMLEAVKALEDRSGAETGVAGQGQAEPVSMARLGHECGQDLEGRESHTLGPSEGHGRTLYQLAKLVNG